MKINLIKYYDVESKNKIYLFLKSPNIDDITKERLTEIFKDKSYYKEKI